MKGNKRKQNGITLIALIITIIVMLILVGVTINVALNGRLFEKAQDAANDTQKEAEREELQMAVAAAYNVQTGTISKTELITNLGNDWTVSGEEGGPYTVISPKGNIFTVDAKGNIDYKGKTTTDSGENPSENENPLKMKIVQAYDMPTKTVELKITPEITDDETAVEILVELVNTMSPGSNASTLQDVNLFFANMGLEDNQEPYSDYSALVAEMAKKMGKSNPTDQEIFAYVSGGLTLKKMAANGIIMQGTFVLLINGKTIEENDENLDTTEEEIEYNGITENGEYNIQLKFGDKIASETITVSTIVTEGTTVESAEIEKGYWYDVTSAYTGIEFERVFSVVYENSNNDKNLLGFIKLEGNELARLPMILGINIYFRENFEENGITYQTALVKKKDIIGSGSSDYEIFGWITKQGNLVLKNSTTEKFMEFAKQQMPNYTEGFVEIYDTTLNTSNIFSGIDIFTISFGLLENGKCQYIYRDEENGIEMICSNGPVNYRIEDGKLIVEEIEEWDYDAGTGGTGTGTYKEYTIGTEAIKR